MFQSQKEFKQVYLTKGKTPVFCYRSGLFVYEEVFKNNMLVTGGFNASGYPLDVLNGYPSRIDTNHFMEPNVFNIELDGECIDHDLKYVDFKSDEEDGILKTVITLESNIKPVRIYVNTILDGTGMLTRYLEIENLSKEPLRLNKLSCFSACLEDFNTKQFTLETPYNKMFSAGYFENDRWAREGAFKWHDITSEEVSVNCCFTRDRFRHPLIFIKNNLKGTIFFSQIAWGAGCSFKYDYHPMPEESNVKLNFKAEINSYSPITVIKPNEKLTTPEVYFGLITGGLDDAVNEMHNHIRRSVLANENAKPNLEVIGAMGPEHDMTVETTKEFMKRAADLGCEIFTIDAGWYAPLEMPVMWGDNCGIYEANEERYPNGFKEIVDYCHSLKMKFALWADIEHAGKNSGIREEHPDWFIVDREDVKCDYLLDLTNPTVYNWAKETLANVIRKYEVDMLRVDNNLTWKNQFGIRDLGSGIKECTSFRRFNAVYKLYNELKNEFPDVIFENCAGGGGRTDLGMMKNFNHTWVSDCQRPPFSFMITNGMTMALPPERVDRLFAGMGCHEWGAFDAHMRNTMLCHMSLNATAPSTTIDNPIQVDFVKRSVSIYKNFIRDMLPTSKIYHHTENTASNIDGKISIIELSAQDRTKSAITVTTLTAANDERYTVYPKGIDASYNYKVTLDNYNESYIVSGYELKQKGVTVIVPASLSSELVLMEKC